MHGIRKIWEQAPVLQREHGAHRIKILALWTLVVVMVFVAGRLLLFDLRPQLEEEPPVQELEEEARDVLQYIDDRVQGAARFEIGDDNERLKIWQALDPHVQHQEMPEERYKKITFRVDNENNLVARSDHEVRILAQRIEDIHFEQLDAAHVGIVMQVREEAEFIEVRHLVELRKKEVSD